MLNEFFTWLEMGGYGSYVWTAYGCLFLVFIFHLMGIRLGKTRIWKKLEQESKRYFSE